MAGNDWIYSVGVDTTKADQKVADFVANTTRTLGRIPTIELRVNNRGALSAVREFVEDATKQIRSVPRVITVRTDTTGATADVKAFATQMKGALGTVNTGPLKSGFTSLTSSISGASRAIREQGDAFDFLGRVGRNTIFKFIEYELAMKAFNAVVGEVGNALKEAGNVQFEQMLQRLYGATYNQNEALSKSVTIARQWGASITDVLQVQGLFAKQFNDINAATVLADRAEQMHRASGIDTIEVYQKSIAMLSQLGGTGNDLIKIYDQLAEASLKLAVPMNNLGQGKGQVEALKDMFEGMAASAAALKSVGFDNTGIEAVVQQMIQATGKNGNEVGSNLSNMVAAMEGQGSHRKVFEDIIGPAKDTDTVLKELIDHANDLRQAFVDKGIGVKTQQFETLNTFLSALEKIKKAREDLEKSSGGKLQIIAEAEMETFIGESARAVTSTQQITQAIGAQLLPAATKLLSTWVQIAPTLAHSAGAMVSAAGYAARLGVAYLALLAIGRVSSAIQKFSISLGEANAAQASYTLGSQRLITMIEAQAAAELGLQRGTSALAVMMGISSKEMIASELATAEGFDAANAAMIRQKKVIAQLEKQEEILLWETRGLADAEERLGLETGAVAEIAATKAVVGFELMGKAIMGATGMFMRAIGPLLLIQTLMSTITTWGDKGEQFNSTADSMAMMTNGQGSQGGFGDVARVAGDAASIGMKYGLTPMNPQSGRTYDSQIKAMEGDKEFGPRVRGTEDALAEAMNTGDIQRVHDLTDRMKSLNQQFMMKGEISEYGDTMKDALAKAQAALSKTQGDGAGDLPGVLDKSKEKGLTTPEDQLRHQLDAEKRDYQAEMSLHRDAAAAYKDEAEAITKLAELHGWNAESVEKLRAAYKGEIDQTQMVRAAAEAEAEAMRRKEIEAQREIFSTKAGTNAREKALTSISMAHAAYLKAEGAVRMYDGSLTEMIATEQKAVASATILAHLRSTEPTTVHGSTTLPGSGLTLPSASDQGIRTLEDYVRRAESVASAAEKATGAVTKFNSEMSAKDQIMKDVKTLHDEYEASFADFTAPTKVDPKTGQNLGGQGMSQADAATALGPLYDVLRRVDTILQGVNKSATDGAAKINEVGVSLKKLSGEIGDKNLATLQDILGTDKGQNTYIDNLAKGWQEITNDYNEIDKLQKEWTINQGELSDDQTKILASARAEVDLRRQLLALDAQIKAIRESEIYKATQSTADKYGTQSLNQSIDKILGDDTKTSSTFSKMLGDWTKQIVDSWFSNAVRNITDKALVPTAAQQREDQLKAVYNAHAAAVKDAAAKMLEAGKDMVTAATIMANKNNGGTPQTQSNGAVVGAQAGVSLLGNGSNPPAGYYNGLTSPTDVNTDLVNQQAPAAQAQAQATQANGTVLSQILSAMQALSKAGALGGALGNGSGNGTLGSDVGKALGEASGITALMQQLAKGTEDRTLNPSAGQKDTVNILGSISQGIGGLSQVIMGNQTGGISGAIQSASGMAGIVSAFGKLIPGPVGIGLDVAAGLFGLFGHQTNQAAEPDIYDTQNYGQGVANLTGKEAGANGQSFDPNQMMLNEDGGMGLISFIEEQLAAGKPSWESSLSYQQMVAMFGESSTGSGKLNFGTDIADQWITGAAGANGQVQNYKTLDNMAQQFFQEYEANKGQEAAPLISINAYGTAKGYMPNAYNTPGMNADELNALKSNNWSSYPNSSLYGGSPVQTSYNPYGSPTGSQTLGANAQTPVYTQSVTQPPITITTQLVCDGATLAKIVNAVNQSNANRSGMAA
jgi:hypothetical protein